MKEWSHQERTTTSTKTEIKGGHGTEVYIALLYKKKEIKGVDILVIHQH
jgi:hypothetical protein